MANILNALVNLKKTAELSVGAGISGNRIQIVGSGLESYIKDLLSGVSAQTNEKQKQQRYSDTFSYAGNANNPPDIILKNGDAIEVKKADSLTAGIQLNSSPPKAKLLSSDSRINNTCRQLALDEGWTEKDIFYAIGSLGSGNLLKRLWFVYGDCFAANHDVYQKAAEKVTGAINQSFEETELVQTNELAGVPKVDPLGITHLRVRGMWIVKNPAVVFEDIIPASNKDAKFRAYCLMLSSKYNSFSRVERGQFEQQIDGKMLMDEVKIRDPNNPVKLLEAKLISYEV
jgi:hypothetical protein